MIAGGNKVGTGRSIAVSGGDVLVNAEILDSTALASGRDSRARIEEAKRCPGPNQVFVPGFKLRARDEVVPDFCVDTYSRTRAEYRAFQEAFPYALVKTDGTKETIVWRGTDTKTVEGKKATLCKKNPSECQQLQVELRPPVGKLFFRDAVRPAQDESLETGALFCMTQGKRPLSWGSPGEAMRADDYTSGILYIYLKKGMGLRCASDPIAPSTWGVGSVKF